MKKRLSCFCNNNHYQPFSISRIDYGIKTKALVEDVSYSTDYEPEAVPSFITNGPFSHSDYLIVRYSVKKKENRYVRDINQINR